MIPRSKEDAQRCTSSPGCFLGSHRSESHPELTLTSPIPTSLLQRGTAKIHRLNELQSDSFNRVAYIFMAELRGLFSWHGRAYSGEVKFAGARVCGHLQRRERERTGCSSRVPLAAENVFIVVQGWQPSSRASEDRRWIGPLAALHRVASLLEEEDDGPLRCVVLKRYVIPLMVPRKLADGAGTNCPCAW
jgi:hypothetical protein